MCWCTWTSFVAAAASKRRPKPSRPPSASQDKSQLVDSRLQRLVIVQLFALYCRTIPNIADNWRQTRRFLRVRSLRCEAAGSVVCRDLREAIQPSMLRHCCFSILSTFAPNFGFSIILNLEADLLRNKCIPLSRCLNIFICLTFSSQKDRNLKIHFCIKYTEKMDQLLFEEFFVWRSCTINRSQYTFFCEKAVN